MASKGVGALLRRFDDVQIALPHKRQGLPGLGAVGRLDQSEVGRQAFTQVGVSTGEEVLRTDDRESHGVLPAVGHSLGPSIFDRKTP